LRARKRLREHQGEERHNAYGSNGKHAMLPAMMRVAFAMRARYHRLQAQVRQFSRSRARQRIEPPVTDLDAAGARH